MRSLILDEDWTANGWLGGLGAEPERDQDVENLLDAIDEAFVEGTDSLESALQEMGFDPDELACRAVELQEPSIEGRGDHAAGGEGERREHRFQGRSEAAPQESLLRARAKVLAVGPCHRGTTEGDPPDAPGHETAGAGSTAAEGAPRRLAVFVCVDPRLGEERATVLRMLRRGASPRAFIGRIGCPAEVIDLAVAPTESALARARRCRPSTACFILVTCEEPLDDTADEGDGRASSRLSFRASPAFRPWAAAGMPRALVFQRRAEGEAESSIPLLGLQEGLGGQLPEGARSQVRPSAFSDSEDLRHQLERELVEWLLEIREGFCTPEGRSPVRDLRGSGLTLLCLAFVEPVALAEPGWPDSFWGRVAAEVAPSGGTLVGTLLDYALFTFSGEGRHGRAVLAAARVLEKPAPVQNAGASGRVWMRAAVHESGGATGQGFAAWAFLVTLLEREQSQGGSRLLITAAVRQHLDSALRSSFAAQKRLEGEPVWMYRVEPDGASARDALEERIEEIQPCFDALEDSLAANGGSKNCLESVSAALDDVFSSLEDLCGRFGEAIGQSDDRDLRRLSDLLKAVRRREESAWQRLAGLGSSAAGGAAGESAWKAILSVAGARRASLAGLLEALASKLRVRTSTVDGGFDTFQPWVGLLESVALEDDPASFGVGMLEAVRQLAEGDELDAYGALADLTGSFKEDLILFLGRTTCPLEGVASSLRERLWRHADLLVAEDRSEGNRLGRWLLPYLVAGPMADSRFKALMALLRAEDPVDEAEAELERAGAPSGPAEVETLWRCLLVAHWDHRILGQAAARTRVGSLWHLGAYPRTPLTTLAAILERFADAGLEDYGRVFFDCIRSRLQGHLSESLCPAEDLKPLGGILARLVEFRFAVTTRYFERLRLLLDLYFRQTKHHGESRRLDERWKDLCRRRSGGPEPRLLLPAGLGQLPAAVHRHLASEGEYLEHFSCHPDYRIAREARRFLTPDNVVRFLKVRSLNLLLFQDVLRQPELMQSRAAVQAALKHPKCDWSFARRHLPTLSKGQLLEMVRNHDASHQVRAVAERLLDVRGFLPRTGGARAQGGGKG